MTASAQTFPPQHAQIAEQGKVFALEKDFSRALGQFRQALKLALEKDPQTLFPRHYMECTMEVLEWAESYDEIISYCEKALDHYQSSPPASQIAAHDYAHVYQRQGIIFLKTEKLEQAKESFAQALSVAKDNNLKLPIAETFLQWISRRFQISTEKVESLLRKHNYYSIRKETVNPAIAVALPDEMIFQTR